MILKKICASNNLLQRKNKPPLPCARVSIIGSRHASEKGLLEAEEITKILIKNQAVIVSGLAKGINSVGHKTAIKNGGKTIVVLVTPLNKTYPKENIKLQEEIMKDHLVISQYQVGYKTTPKDSALRNRTMALISDASVIVKAGETSGTLYQGWETIRLGRPLFICKQAVHNSKLKWPKEMIEYGAIELDEPVDILENLPSKFLTVYKDKDIISKFTLICTKGITKWKQPKHKRE